MRMVTQWEEELKSATEANHKGQGLGGNIAAAGDTQPMMDEGCLGNNQECNEKSLHVSNIQTLERKMLDNGCSKTYLPLGQRQSRRRDTCWASISELRLAWTHPKRIP